MNNRLVSVDLKTGEELELANSIDLHRRLRREADTLAEQVVVSAAATPSDDGAAAFLVMDYERVYGIGLLGADHRLDQLKVEVLPGGGARLGWERPSGLQTELDWLTLAGI